MTKARSGGRARRRARSLPRWTAAGTVVEELDGQTVEVRVLQPYQAVKAYPCPGCHATIAEATGHLVVVPVAAPEDRRHWHRSCWARRDQRPPR